MGKTENTFKAKYIKTVPCFSAGNLVSCNTYRKIAHWNGNDEVRKTRNKTYLVISGSDYYGNSIGYAEHIFEVISPIESMSIEGLDYYDLDSTPMPGEIVEITFSSEAPNYQPT